MLPSFKLILMGFKAEKKDGYDRIERKELTSK